MTHDNTMNPNSDSTSKLRPFLRHSAHEVIDLARDSGERDVPSLDFLVRAWAELIDERNSRLALRSQLETFFLAAGMRPEPWLGAALKAAQGVTRQTRGNHHLYVLASNGFGEDGLGAGLYVGRSRYRPQRRFEQHTSGDARRHAARRFRLDRNGTRHVPLQLLPSFFAHLNPLSKAEAEVLEVALVHALLKAGVPVGRVDGPRGRMPDELDREESVSVAA